MEVHHAQATPTAVSHSQPPLTFSFIGDFFPRVGIVTSEYGVDCTLPSLNSSSDYSTLSDDSSLYCPIPLKSPCNDKPTDYSAFQPISSIKQQEELEKCGGCQLKIQDKTIIFVENRFYHESCLVCHVCSSRLGDMPTCYNREKRFFCKTCYFRIYGTKCSSCDRIISSTDWVRRAKQYVYHLACFACNQCKRQLSTGEEYALQEGKLLCKQHYLEIIDGEAGIAHQKAKTKRVRTTFAEEQLSVLQAHFQVDSNPDGADLERIANITGLSKRVTQVWFQNSRARQKKYNGHRKGGSGEETEDSQRGSTGPMSPEAKSDMSNDMLYPTSVTTTAEEAMCDVTHFD